jgi:tetratricopeptide (TPR) repeat protein
MVLSTVFAIDDELENGIASGKYFWFYSSVFWVAGGTVLSFVMNRKPVYLNKTDLFVFLFGITGLVSSYIQNSALNTRFILFLLCWILYFYFRIVLGQNRFNRYILILFLLVTGLLEAVWGLRQLHGYVPSYHGLYKLTGTFFNPGPYGGYLAVIAPVACYFLLRDYAIFKHRFSKKLILFYIRYGISALTLFSIIVVLPAAMSRASWLAAIGGCILVGVVRLLHNKRLSQLFKAHKRNAIVFLIVTGVAFITGSIGMYHLKKDSADGRALMWKIALLTAIEHPAGVGLGNFAGSYGNEQEAYFASGQGTEQEEHVAGAPEYAFNEYLQMAVELGIVPLMLYPAAIISAIYTGIKRKRTGKAGALFSLSIFAFMSYPYSVLPFVILLSFLLASVSSATPEKGIKAGTGMTGFAILVLTIIVIACIFNRKPAYKAYHDWKEVKMLYSMKMYKDAVDDYRELASYLNDRSAFMFEYSQCLSKTEEYKESNTVIRQAIRISGDPMFYNIMGKNYQALNQLDSAEICFRKAAHIIPNRIYPYYLLANLYLQAGDTVKAMAMAQIVLTKEPKTETMAIEEMRKEMKKISSKPK